MNTEDVKTYTSKITQVDSKPIRMEGLSFGSELKQEKEMDSKIAKNKANKVEFITVDVLARGGMSDKPKENILIEADRIINGDRKAQYGDQRQNFQKYGRIATEMLDAEELEAMKRGEITDTIVTKVLIAMKLGRESFKHKRDNLTDLCGYSAILNELQE